MFYNRTESYRHSFGKPPEFRMEISDYGNIHSCVLGLLLDVSARGAKIYSEKELPTESGAIKLTFKISHENIKAEGKLVWKSKTSDGWIYGVEWLVDPVREMVIADEIKSRIANR